MEQSLFVSARTWAFAEAKTRGLSDGDAGIVADIVIDRVERYWDSRGLEDIFDPLGSPAERYVRKMAKNAASTLRAQQSRRQDVEHLAGNGGRSGKRLPTRPGVRRQSELSSITPDTAELAERYVMYEMAMQLADAHLPNGQKRDFKLFASGLRPSEIAELRGVSRQAVTDSLRRAFAVIRSTLL